MTKTRRKRILEFLPDEKNRRDLEEFIKSQEGCLDEEVFPDETTHCIDDLELEDKFSHSYTGADFKPDNFINLKKLIRPFKTRRKCTVQDGEIKAARTLIEEMPNELTKTDLRDLLMLNMRVVDQVAKDYGCDKLLNNACPYGYDVNCTLRTAPIRALALVYWFKALSLPDDDIRRALTNNKSENAWNLTQFGVLEKKVSAARKKLNINKVSAHSTAAKLDGCTTRIDFSCEESSTTSCQSELEKLSKELNSREPDDLVELWRNSKHEINRLREDDLCVEKAISLLNLSIDLGKVLNSISSRDQLSSFRNNLRNYGEDKSTAHQIVELLKTQHYGYFSANRPDEFLKPKTQHDLWCDKLEQATHLLTFSCYCVGEEDEEQRTRGAQLAVRAAQLARLIFVKYLHATPLFNAGLLDTSTQSHEFTCDRNRALWGWAQIVGACTYTLAHEPTTDHVALDWPTIPDNPTVAQVGEVLVELLGEQGLGKFVLRQGYQPKRLPLSNRNLLTALAELWLISANLNKNQQEALKEFVTLPEGSRLFARNPLHKEYGLRLWKDTEHGALEELHARVRRGNELYPRK